jgi:CBS domain-containing protein
MQVEPIEPPGVLTDLTVRDAMRHGFVTCLPSNGLPTLAAILVAHGVHAMVLEPEGDGEPLIVTDMELMRAALEQADDVSAGDMARVPMVTLPSDAPLELAVARMVERYVPHVLATDPATGVPCGILSSFDIANVLGGHPPDRAHTLRHGPTHPASCIRALREVTAGEVMHRGVVTCSPDAPLRAVGRSMAQHHVHCVAVAGVDVSPAHPHHYSWGLIDDLELVRALHRGALDDCAGAIAVTGPIAVLEHDSLELATKLMIEDGARHVVVVGPSGLPSGMVSTLDVASILAGAPDRDRALRQVGAANSDG